MAVLQIRK